MSRNQSSSRQYASHKINDIIASSPPHLELLPEPGYESELRGTIEVLPSHPHDLAWYRMLYEHMPAIYLTLEPTGRILSVNQFGANVLGLTSEKLINKHISDLFAPFELSRIRNILMELAGTSPQETADGEFQLGCPNTNIAWVRITARKLTILGSEPIILMVCEDITDQKRSEDALRESEQRFHAIAEIAPVMLWTASVDGFFNFFNQYWLEFTGTNMDRARGYGWLNVVHPEERLHCLHNYHAALKERQEFVLEYRLLHHDGEYRWILDTGIPRFTPTGLFNGYIGCAVDITERKAAEQALTQSQNAVQAQIGEMEKLNRLKDEFLSTVSHELRTPLTNMKMAIQMLGIALKIQPEGDFKSLSDGDALKINRYFHILNNECDREINLINNFLDLQKLDSQSKSLVLETVTISEWLERIIAVFQSRHRRFTQSLHLQIAENLPPLTCDPFSLERIIIELLTNACKFSPSNGEIYLQVQLAGNGIELIVTNTGAEIPASEITHIFDKFYRIPSNDPWKQGGTGLGLALVKKLTQYQGGEIKVISQSNRTSFTVIFPLPQTPNK